MRHIPLGLFFFVNCSPPNFPISVGAEWSGESGWPKWLTTSSWPWPSKGGRSRTSAPWRPPNSTPSSKQGPSRPQRKTPISSTGGFIQHFSTQKHRSPANAFHFEEHRKPSLKVNLRGIFPLFLIYQKLYSWL